MNVRQQFIHAALATTLLSMVGAVRADQASTGKPPKAQADNPGSTAGSSPDRVTKPSDGASPSMPPWSMDNAPPAAGMRGDAASQPDDKASGAAKGKKHKSGSKAKAQHNQGSASNADTDPVDPHGAYRREGGASSPR